MNNDKEKIIEDDALPQSIRSVVKIYPSNQINRLHYGGLPHIGNALWSSWSSDEIQKAADAYENYSLSTNLLISGFNPPRDTKVRLGGGSPASFESFPQCLNSLKDTLENGKFSAYPLAAGDDELKLPIIDYFEKKYSKNIVKNNIIYTHSSTQAFTLVMESILDYGDVVIMTAPNYGLFTFIPERVGGKVKFLELSNDDNWKINSYKLKHLIDATNHDLRIDYDRNRSKYVFRQSDTQPKVCAFVNYNPHNPTGVVYSNKDKSLLLKVSRICKNAGIFIIDDLAYSGLEYDRKNISLPICSLDNNFDNTITLYTLSKSYGLAGLRSGMIVANEIVISLIRDRIFQMSDSLSTLQQVAISAVFKSDVELQKEKYFAYITHEYYERFVFVKTILLGLNKVNKQERKVFDKIIQSNKLNFAKQKDLNGVADLEILTEPASGFFVLLNLTKFIGKSHRGFKILDDKTLLQFLYTFGNIKSLTGNAFCWPKNNQLVIRATFAFDYRDLLDSYLRLKKVLGLLK